MKGVDVPHQKITGPDGASVFELFVGFVKPQGLEPKTKTWITLH